MKSFIPNDFGPIYTETTLATAHADGHPATLPVEPWNTASNLVFLFVLIYWAAKMRRPENRRPLLMIALPILLVGFVGGTVYHGTRSDDIWRILDFGPIYILLSMTVVFMWNRVLGDWKKTVIVAPALIFGLRLLAELLAPETTYEATRGYLVMAANVTLPTLLYARILAWQHVRTLAMTLACFTVAIVCRQFDGDLTHVFPQGTHFLWHTFGGLSTHFLVRYVFLTSASRVERIPMPTDDTDTQIKIAV